MEAFFEGKYYWVPFHHIQKIETEKPSDLRDLVWLPAQFTWTNGGSVCAAYSGALSRYRGIA